jgi:Trk-type K+ transport system membrane component
MFRFYFLVVILGAVLLYLPVSLQHGYEIYAMIGGTEQDSGRAYTFWDALFVSCSAITDTGLTPIQLAINYTGFGQAVILVLMEIGGIGIMAIIFFI